MRTLFPILLLSLHPAAQAQFTQQGTKLVGTGASVPSSQGSSGALSADGNTAIVGSRHVGEGTFPGALWVFTRSNGAWTQQGPELVNSGASDPSLGVSVALSADGNTAIAGGPFNFFVNQGIGGAWVFTRSNGVWSQQGTELVPSDASSSAEVGLSVALSADGNTALVGGPSDSGSAGAAWVFTRANGVWSQQGHKLVGTGALGPASQGTGVALSADGNTALVGGNSDDPNSLTGATWVFTRANGVWSQQGAKLVGTGASGASSQGVSVALSADGNTALIGGPGDTQLPSLSCSFLGSVGSVGIAAGAAWVFTRSNGVWTQQGNKLSGTGAVVGAYQGSSVVLSGDGNTALVGGPSDAPPGGGCNGTGATWVFTRHNGAWSQQGSKLVGTGAANDSDGGASQKVVALSADGSTALVGGATDNGNVGALWVFTEPVATRFVVSAPASATGGAAFNFTVTAQDVNHNSFPNYQGTVHFTSTDAAAVLPADTALINGGGAFSATLATGGSQTITATDTVNATLAGTSSPITVSATAVTPPSPVSVNISNSTYTFTYFDPRAYQDLGVVNVLVNNFLDGRHACYLAYVVATNSLVLVDDAGDAGGPYAGAQNSQCAVSLVSATGAGDTLTLVLTITWTTSFAGDKIIHMAARDIAQNNSGWHPLGVVRVPGGAQTTTTAVVSMSPNQGSGLGPNPFTFNWSDTLGSQDLGVENILVNSSLDGRQACYLAFSRPGNVLYLVNDNGDGLLPGQSLAAAGSLTNSQCTASWTANPATAAGNNLSLTLNIAFTAAFAGNRVIYVAARDVNEANNTDWHAMGTWTPR